MLLFNEYGIYTSWAEIPLHKALRLWAIPVDQPEAYLPDLLECLTDCPRDYILKLDVAGALSLLATAGELLQSDLPTEPIESFDFEGVRYVASPTKQGIPMAALTTEEMVEAYHAQQSGEMLRIGFTDKLPLLIATLFRPEGEGYTEAKAHERAEAFLRLPTSIAMQAAFFLRGSMSISKRPTLPFSVMTTLPMRKRNAQVKSIRALWSALCGMAGSWRRQMATS
jgi:hypothetical protein